MCMHKHKNINRNRHLHIYVHMFYTQGRSTHVFWHFSLCEKLSLDKRKYKRNGRAAHTSCFHLEGKLCSRSEYEVLLSLRTNFEQTPAIQQ